MTSKKIIYDFGANNGDDIPYYLLKADLVVAIEADPSLYQFLCNRFCNEIKEGKLIVENCVLSEGLRSEQTPFYIHKSNNLLNQFPEPTQEQSTNFKKIFLNGRSASSLVQQYGNAMYIKIDVENYDKEILRDLFKNNIYPQFISAESHDIDVFCSLVALGGYNSFKIVNSDSVSQIFKNYKIKDKDGSQKVIEFLHHSAGPFGEDLPGEWMTANNFARHLMFEGLGWKDIHATNQIKPNIYLAPRLKQYFKEAIKFKLKNAIKNNR